MDKQQISTMTVAEAQTCSPEYRKTHGFEAWLEVSIQLWREGFGRRNPVAATWDYHGSSVK